MKEPKLSIVAENPEQTLFDRMSTAKILGIGISTLDSCITVEELPRVKIKKRTYFLRTDIIDSAKTSLIVINKYPMCPISCFFDVFILGRDSKYLSIVNNSLHYFHLRFISAKNIQ